MMERSAILLLKFEEGLLFLKLDLLLGPLDDLVRLLLGLLDDLLPHVFTQSLPLVDELLGLGTGIGELPFVVLEEALGLCLGLLGLFELLP